MLYIDSANPTRTDRFPILDLNARLIKKKQKKLQKPHVI